MRLNCTLRYKFFPKVLPVVKMLVTAFWVVTLYNIVAAYQRFRGTYWCSLHADSPPSRLSTADVETRDSAIMAVPYL
jgi:hypothetical protein